MIDRGQMVWVRYLFDFRPTTTLILSHFSTFYIETENLVANETISSANQNSSEVSANCILWQVDILPTEGQPDRIGLSVLDNANDLKLPKTTGVKATRGFLIQGNLDYEEVKLICDSLLVEPVVEQFNLAHVGDPIFEAGPTDYPNQVYVLPLPGVTDPEAESALMAIKQLGFDVDAVRTFKKYWLTDIPDDARSLLASKVLCNDSTETIVEGKLEVDKLDLGTRYQFEKNVVELTGLSDEELLDISKQWQLSLTLIEMQTIRNHFEKLQRAPTDIELETLAQTWSEHCSHKTLAGRISYQDENGEIQFENMLKETIFAATMQIRSDLGDEDWCVSVFEDNAGIVKFDDQFNVAFKVETHNRPSALEPYGGANTGIGGVIRDTLGTGLGAKPVCNTDVFCFADPDTPYEYLPPGVMHPKLIMKGVVAGVRDYGNRMGIPTVNGAVYFDQRYVGNPLVFCGNVGLLPKEKSFKEPVAGDLIVSIGGRTGRDGIHGATFSSSELTESSDITSGGAVQIGNAITEKMAMDVLLQARDRGLYNAVTDCGAGGYSSAVGEMGEKIGAEVWLEKVPLKYDGLSYTEIWISEAQERMVFSVSEESWPEFERLCKSESVEACVIGKFVPTGNLTLKYEDQLVGELSMEFMHDGRPPVIRKAVYEPTPVTKFGPVPNKSIGDLGTDICRILQSPNVASKHWIIRQYDHEVQGGSVVKPLVGIQNDGPSDAAVVRPVLNSRRGLAISCGMNPHYGDFDTYHMATSAIDEAIRNCVAVGADPSKIAILDNFCWGYTDRPSTLGALVRAAIACKDMSTVLQTPFISGKDSLNNEFSYTDSDGSRKTITIPSTLLISAMGQVPDVGKCVTMDLKEAKNALFMVGVTGDHFGGSHWAMVNQIEGGKVPTVDFERAKKTFASLHKAIQKGLVQSCHDISEGGMIVAAAEMAFAGGFGARIITDYIGLEIPEADENSPVDLKYAIAAMLFSESNTRFIVELKPSDVESFQNVMQGVEICPIGYVREKPFLTVETAQNEMVNVKTDVLKACWLQTLDWK